LRSLRGVLDVLHNGYGHEGDIDLIDMRHDAHQAGKGGQVGHQIGWGR